ncbi:MAG: ribbon-helix-helix protein, CopG family [Actinomycetota bacterium]
MGYRSVSVSLEEKLLVAVDRAAGERGMKRSEFVDAALREHLARLAERELEEQLGLAAKMDNLAELVDERADDLRELTLRRTNAAVGMSRHALRVAERIYAVLEAQFAANPKFSYEEAEETARRRVQEALGPREVREVDRERP